MSALRHRIAGAALMLLAIGSGPAGASEASPDFLPAAEQVRRAIASHPQLRVARSQRQQAEAEARGLAAGPHEFTLELAPQRRRIRGGPRFNEYEASLSRGLRWPGKARLDRQIGALGTALAGTELGEAEHELGQRLLQRWLDWLQAEAAHAQAEEQHRLLQEDRAAVARRVELGDAAALELDVAEASLARSRAALRAAESAALAARTLLRGDFPDLALPERAPGLPDPQLDAPGLERMGSRLLAGSHALDTARQATERESLRARRAQAERRPDPSLGLRWLDEEDGQERAVGISLSIPLGSRQRRAEATAALAAADASQAQLDAIERELGIRTGLRVTATRQAIAIWQDQAAALAAVRASSARIRRAHALGEVGMAELIMARQLESEAALAELDARAQAHRATLELRLDAHELWPEAQ